jgi:hypothetical protein
MQLREVAHPEAMMAWISASNGATKLKRVCCRVKAAPYVRLDPQAPSMGDANRGHDLV